MRQLPTLSPSSYSFLPANGVELSKLQEKNEAARVDLLSLRRQMQLLMHGAVAAQEANRRAAPGSRSLSLREVDRESVSQTFSFIQRLTKSEGDVPLGPFVRAFEALFLPPGRKLGCESTALLRSSLDSDGDGLVSELEYTTFFQLWIAKDPEKFCQNLDLRGPDEVLKEPAAAESSAAVAPSRVTDTAAEAQRTVAQDQASTSDDMDNDTWDPFWSDEHKCFYYVNNKTSESSYVNF